jgi:hypothetical protein
LSERYDRASTMWGIPGGDAAADAGTLVVPFQKVSRAVVVGLLFDFFDFNTLLFE